MQSVIPKDVPRYFSPVIALFRSQVSDICRQAARKETSAHRPNIAKSLSFTQFSSLYNNKHFLYIHQLVTVIYSMWCGKRCLGVAVFDNCTCAV